MKVGVGEKRSVHRGASGGVVSCQVSTLKKCDILRECECDQAGTFGPSLTCDCAPADG